MDPAVDLFTHFPSLVSCLRSSGGHFDISYLLLSRLVVVPPATRQRKVKVEKRRREFTMLLQYKSLHVTTFTNPCNKFEKSFANLTKHTSTRQWSKKGEGREKVERFYSSDCNVQCFSNKISLKWTRGVFKGRQRDWAKVYRVRVSQKTDHQNAAGATLHPLNHQ